MQQVGGVVMPADEVHMKQWMINRNHVVNGKLTYQYHKLEASLKRVKQFRLAVDIGGHCGFWSMHLVDKFVEVHAFEPVARHRDCFTLNVNMDHCILHPEALGAEPGWVSMKSTPTSSGGTMVAGPGDIEMRMLDSYGLSAVDFIKVDLEGFELFALRGAEETIKRWMPVITVEQKPGHGQQFGLGDTDAVSWLLKRGYKLAQELGGDYIMVPK